MNKSVLALRHVPFEDLGLLTGLLTERGFDIEYREAGNGGFDGVDPLASDLLVVLGGPIGAYEDDLYPFVSGEIDLIERRLKADLPILGICLGAQMMARALGAKVYPGTGKEIGYAPLILTGEGKASCLRHLAPDETPVLHWHGDTFDLPAGAVRLASTPQYANQAFAWGKAALALQFHGEMAADGLEPWLIGHACEIAATKGVSVPGLRADCARHGAKLERQGRACFGEWLAGAGL